MTVEIRNDTFHASIILERLAELPIPKIRKIFKLMSNDPSNKPAIDQTAIYLTEAIPGAKAEWAYAYRDYCNGWSLKTTRATRANNRKLIANVRKAKSNHDRLCRIQTIFNQIIKE